MDQSGRALSDTLTLLRDAVGGLQSEDLHGVDSGSLLTDVADLRRLADQVEGEWLRRVGEVHARGAADVGGCGVDEGVPAWDLPGVARGGVASGGHGDRAAVDVRGDG